MQNKLPNHHMQNKFPDHHMLNKLPDYRLLNKLPHHHMLNKLPEHRLLNNLQDLQSESVNGTPVLLHGENIANYKVEASGNDKTKKMSEKCRQYPDIIIIGFEKCGTMTLRSIFGAHPEIFLTKTAENIPYFNSLNRGYKSFATFTKHMECAPPGKLKLEKISEYGSAVEVYETLPNVRLLAIVREPVERAMSQYVHLVALNKEKPNKFETLVETLLNRRTIENETDIISRIIVYSTYIDRFKPWLQTFGRDKIHIVDGDSFVKHPAFELNKIEQFLNISKYFTDDHFVYNPEKKFYCLNKAGCMGRNKGRPHPNMTEITRKRLQTYFKTFNEKLFDALGQRFSWNY